jgi:hypothetical protein
MQIVALRFKYALLIGLLVPALLTPVAFALRNPAPPPVAVSNHIPASALLYQQPVAAAPRTSVRAPRPAYRAPVRLPVTDSVSRAPASPAAIGSNCARVVAAWQGDKAWVLRNARRESGCDPHAYAPPGTQGPNAYFGVLQTDIQFWHTYGGGPGDPRSYSIEQQVAVAWRGFQARGCRPWGCR